jgi:hypothetical protein
MNVDANRQILPSESQFARPREFGKRIGGVAQSLRWGILTFPENRKAHTLEVEAENGNQDCLVKVLSAIAPWETKPEDRSWKDRV